MAHIAVTIVRCTSSHNYFNVSTNRYRNDCHSPMHIPHCIDSDMILECWHTTDCNHHYPQQHTHWYLHRQTIGITIFVTNVIQLLWKADSASTAYICVYKWNGSQVDIANFKNIFGILNYDVHVSLHLYYVHVVSTHACINICYRYKTRH